jgi:hypothetical protein
MKLASDLHITWEKRESFLRAYDKTGPGRYTVESPAPGLLPVGSARGSVLPVCIEFQGTHVSFRHHALIADIHPGPPECMTFEFLPEEAGIRDLILSYVAGEALPFHSRRRMRSAVWMPVRIRVPAAGGEWRTAIVQDISDGGAYVHILDPPPPRTVVTLAVSSASDDVVEIAARVVHRRREGPKMGCGVEFRFADAREEDAIADLVRALLQRT